VTVVIGDRDDPMVIGCGDAIAARIPRLWPDHHSRARITCCACAPLVRLAELIDRLDGDGARAGTS
jgi:hypothetical protein